MRRLLFIAIIIMSALMAGAQDFANETLSYRVEYKWGLVQKTAGYATMRLTNKSDRYSCQLTAYSAKWADKFYKLRDTLNCEIRREGFLPLFYEIRSHEGGDDKHETVTYSRSGNTVTGTCTRKKWKKDELVRDESRIITAEGYALDMLSAFYYMRHLPYETWTKGRVLKTNIFSGKERETLTIKYKGIETVTIDKEKYTCYHIKFTFTSGGGKKSSDDIDAWLSTAPGHIPIKLEGSLPVGKIRCFYQKK